eukprot:GHVN01074922.1.p1 GENE.GHVN01074922.1~~GHVN01074922.1.p1  ORF type:complete len:143 (-),score=26.99 GHVN01074922.1:206-634(-)
MMMNGVTRRLLSTTAAAGGLGEGAGAAAAATKRRVPINKGVGKTVFFSNLPYNTEWYNLKDLFRDEGLEAVNISMYKKGGKAMGCCDATFNDEESAQQAITVFNELKIFGRPIGVRLYEQRPRANDETPKMESDEKETTWSN